MKCPCRVGPSGQKRLQSGTYDRLYASDIYVNKKNRGLWKIRGRFCIYTADSVKEKMYAQCLNHILASACDGKSCIGLNIVCLLFLLSEVVKLDVSEFARVQPT